MTSRKPLEPFLLRAAALLAVSPLLLVPGVGWWHFVLGPNLPHIMEVSFGPNMVFLCLFPACCALVVLLILWKGRVGLALGIYFVILAAHLFVGGFEEPNPVRYARFGQQSRIQGVTVECNGVTLGQTPFTISEEEFCEKVKPWDAPPPQTMVDADMHAGTMHYDFSKFRHVPQDIFVDGPFSALQWSLNSDEIRRKMRTSAYWWYFEKDGCTGLGRTGGFSISRRGTGTSIITDVNPSMTFPSLRPHMELLVADLERHDGVPTSEWIEHFRKYQDLLFVDFHTAAREDPELLPALHAVVKDEFRIPDTPTAADCERIVDEILDRVEQRGGFLEPSPESVALDLLGADVANVVTARFLDSPHEAAGGGGRRSSDEWTLTHRADHSVWQLPLEYVMKRHPAPELFGRMVYLAAQNPGRFMPFVAAYQRPEAVEIVRTYLTPFKFGSRSHDRGAIENVLRLAAEVVNPALEDDYRHIVSDRGGDRFLQDDVERFISSRIDAPGIDQDRLADWILHWPPIPDEAKVEALLRMRTPKAALDLYHLASMKPHLIEDAVDKLTRDPNPHCDDFLIRVFRESFYGRRHVESPHVLYKALARLDTPAIHAFVEDMWNKWEEDGWKNLIGEKKELVWGFAHSNWDGPGMEWMVELLAPLTGEEERWGGMRLLAKIGSPEAWDLLDAWAQDGSPAMKDRARDIAEKSRERHAEEQERIQLAEDLIAGRIKPDDLLPPQKAYVWNGDDYVEEEADQSG